MQAPRKITLTKAHVTIVTLQTMELDVSELTKEFGAKARTKKFLLDYAIGNRAGDGVVEEVVFDGLTTEQMYEYQLKS